MSLHGDIEIEKLRRDHAVQTFDCGQLDLNSWLVRYALQNQNANAAQTYVAMADLTVAGYYSLSVGQVEHASAPTRLQKGLARHPIPVMLLARLAVHEDWQRRGVGRLLLADAVVQTKMLVAITNGTISSLRRATHCTCLLCYGISAKPWRDKAGRFPDANLMEI
jgi:GNAT superfamily N-acetyltransferase